LATWPYFLFSISFCWPVFKNRSHFTASLRELNSFFSSNCHGLYAFVDFTLPLLCKINRLVIFSVLPT